MSSRPSAALGIGTGLRTHKLAMMLSLKPNNSNVKAPTARPIPAWGVAPCTTTHRVRGLKARPIKYSIPQIPFVAFDSIFFKERTKLILKRMLLVMRLLRRDVLDQRLQICRAHRKSPISSLPSELRQSRRLRFEPLRRRSLQLRNQLCDIRGARQSNGKMHMVRDASHAIALASGVPRDNGKVRIQLRTNGITQQWPAFLRTEDDMHQDERERQGHRRNYRSGLQPSDVTRNTTWGFAPCWYIVAPSALCSLGTHRTPASTKICKPSS
jgi:hypothetical protein